MNIELPAKFTILIYLDVSVCFVFFFPVASSVSKFIDSTTDAFLSFTNINVTTFRVRRSLIKFQFWYFFALLTKTKITEAYFYFFIFNTFFPILASIQTTDRHEWWQTIKPLSQNDNSYSGYFKRRSTDRTLHVAATEDSKSKLTRPKEPFCNTISCLEVIIIAWSSKTISKINVKFIKNSCTWKTVNTGV